MSRFKSAICGALFLLGVGTLAGCATENWGNQRIADHGNYLKVKLGESRKSNVHALFGQPHDVIYKDQVSVWRYYRIESKGHWSNWVPLVGLATGGQEQNIQRTEFVFDQNGVLADLQTKQASRYRNDLEAITSGLSSQSTDIADDASRETRIKIEMGNTGISFDQAQIIRDLSYYRLDF